MGQAFQESAASSIAFSQLVIINESVESVVLAAVPDVPYKRSVVEPLTVFLEEIIAEPVIQIAFLFDTASR